MMSDNLIPRPIGAESRSEYWAKYLNRVESRNVAEVGVWKGEFASAMLSGCEAIGSYIMIDPWANQDNWNKPFNVSDNKFVAIFEEAMKVTEFAKDKRIVLRNTTSVAANSIENQSLDFVYIDGDHTLRGITLDLISMLPKLRIGGVIGGDDFTITPWQHSPDYEPTLVFPFAVYFAEANGLPIYAIGANQFAILNLPERGFEFKDFTGEYSDLSLNSIHDAKQKA